jgi:putative sigma-54 modulation protein
MRVIIQSPGLKPQQSLIDLVITKISKLEQFSNRIQEARVLLKLDKSNIGANKICEVQLVIPGYDLFAKHKANTFDDATKKVAEALRSQIKSWGSKIKDRS